MMQPLRGISAFLMKSIHRGASQKGVKDENNNFDVFFTIVNFRSYDSVASFILGLLYGISILEMKNKLQQQMTQKRTRRNRRRLTSSHCRRCHSTKTESKDQGDQDSTTIIPFLESIIPTTIAQVLTTTCFRAQRVYITRKDASPNSCGEILYQMLHPNPSYPSISPGHYTCKEPSRLKRLTHCKVYPWESIELEGVPLLFPRLSIAREQESS